MIEHIAYIRWQALGHLYSMTDDIPVLLQNLASPSQQIRHDAITRLSAEIFFRYDNYEASFFVIPFLIELAASQQWSHNDIIIRTLEEIIWGEISHKIAWTPETVVQWVMENLSQFNNFNALEGDNGIDDLLSIQMTSDSFTSIMSPPPLRNIKDAWDYVQVIFHEHFSHEDAPILQIQALIYLFRLYLYFGAEKPFSFLDDDRMLVQAVEARESHSLVKVISALMHIRLLETQAQETVVRSLLDLLIQKELIDEWMLLWPEGAFISRIFDYAGWTLRFLPPEMGPLIFPSLLEIMRQGEQAFRRNPHSVLSEYGKYNEIAHALLYCVFGGTHLPPNAIPFLLTIQQRTVLTTLLTSKLVAIEVLAERFVLFGLPYPWKVRLLLQIEADGEK